MKKAQKASKGFTLGELLLVFAVVLIISASMIPIIRYNNRKMERTVCANNLHQIGLALYIYARENEGQFPPALKVLYDEQYLADKRLMDCPASREIGTPGSPDYIYTAGLSVRSPSLEPLVRDKSKNHPRAGANVLYVNGEVAWH